MIAYSGPSQAHPSAKTIVWREVDLSAGRLTFFTDVRSAKWAALQKAPTLMALLWCPIRRVQLSLSGQVDLSQGTARCTAQFLGLSREQQTAYISMEAPGSLLVEAGSPPLKTLKPELGDRYFGCVDVHISGYDFVSLHKEGHQRVVGTDLINSQKAYWACP